MSRPPAPPTSAVAGRCRRPRRRLGGGTARRSLVAVAGGEGLRRGGSEAVSGGVDSGRLASGGPAVCRLRGFGSTRFSERGTFAGSPTGNLQDGRGLRHPAGTTVRDRVDGSGQVAVQRRPT